MYEVRDGGAGGGRDRHETTKKLVGMKKEATDNARESGKRKDVVLLTRSVGGGRVERGTKCQAFFLTFPFEGICWVDWGGRGVRAGCSEVCR